MSNTHIASPVREDGKVKCFRHNVLLERKVSRTLANPNRGFYSCDIAGPEGESCTFFKWEDELALALPVPAENRKRPASLSGEELTPPNKRPSTAQNDTPRSAGSQARYEAMLRAKGRSSLDPPASQSPLPSRTNVSTSAEHSTSLYRSATPPRLEPTELQWTPQTPPSSRGSAQPDGNATSSTVVSNAPNGTPRSAASQARYEAMLRAVGSSSSTLPGSTTPSPSPSSESSARTTVPAVASVKAEAFLNRPGTPPSTGEHTWAHQIPSASRASASERDRNATSSRTENGMHNGDSLGTAPQLDTLVTPSFKSPPTIGSTGSSREAGMLNLGNNLSPSVREYVDWSNRTAAHIMDLERKLSAAEESNSAKAHRIDQLELEINRLRVRNADLEADIQALNRKVSEGF